VEQQIDYLYLSPCIISQKPGLELLNQYWPHSHGLNYPWKMWFIGFQCTQELQKRARKSETTKGLAVSLPLHHFSKTRTWIAQPILAIFIPSKFILKGVVYSFSMHPRTPRMAQRKWSNKLIICTSPLASFLKKNPDLNYSTNTGHIQKV
jgi:hypothetical protein